MSFPSPRAVSHTTHPSSWRFSLSNSWLRRSTRRRLSLASPRLGIPNRSYSTTFKILSPRYSKPSSVGRWKEAGGFARSQLSPPRTKNSMGDTTPMPSGASMFMSPLHSSMDGSLLMQMVDTGLPRIVGAPRVKSSQRIYGSKPWSSTKNKLQA